jgi:hypothetical protein
MSTETDYKTEAPGANGDGTTVADLDEELQAMRTIVNGLDAIYAALQGVGTDGLEAVLKFADSRYARATSEFRPAKVERASKAPAKARGAKA